VTAIVAGTLISLLGGSRVQIGGPTGAFVVVVFNVITAHGYDGLVLATLLAGSSWLLQAMRGSGGSSAISRILSSQASQPESR
jgi:SulP family sulfate permease